MNSLIVSVADEVVSLLNDQEFSQPFEAKRLYLPLFDRTAMTQMHVTVVPKAEESVLHSRSQTRDDIQIDVAVQQAVDAKDIAKIDSLVHFVEEIKTFLRFRSVANVSWVGTEQEPIYSVDHLAQKQQFTSVLTLTYRIIR